MRPDALKKLLLLLLAPAILVTLAVTLERRGHAAAPFGRPSDPLALYPGLNFYAGEAAPQCAVPKLEPAFAAPTARSGWFQVAVISLFPDADAAETAAAFTRSLLRASAAHLSGNRAARARLLDQVSSAPLSPPVAAEFARLGVRSEVGLGWPGTPADADGAVLALGRLLVVSGLKGDYATQAPHPLLAVHRALGGRAWSQGDPVHDTALVLDLSCDAASAPAAQALAKSVSTYARLPQQAFLRPPWHPQGVSESEQRARETYVDLQGVVETGTSEANLEGLVRRLPYTQTEDDAERLYADMEAEVKRVVVPRLEARAKQPETDPFVAAAFIRDYKAGAAGGGLFSHEFQLPRECAERMGRLEQAVLSSGATHGGVELVPTSATGAYSGTGRARANGARLELGAVSFQRFEQGLLALAVFLQGERCTNLRLAIVER